MCDADLDGYQSEWSRPRWATGGEILRASNRRRRRGTPSRSHDVHAERVSSSRRRPGSGEHVARSTPDPLVLCAPRAYQTGSRPAPGRRPKMARRSGNFIPDKSAPSRKWRDSEVARLLAAGKK